MYPITIPFNKPFATGRELEYISQAITNSHLSGDGEFTKKCHAWLESTIGCNKALLTHSCTAALEMAAILADIQPGDEVIMPSYTFVSTANAFVLRGGVPVFVDIRPDTLNLDESKIEAAITPQTKAIVPVHYAGVACEMDVILEIAHKHNLIVIEDAAQALLSTYRGKPLGGIGHMAALSFHETKNILSGEGGALLINDSRFLNRAEIVREKGTNRSSLFRGEVDKYTWLDIGSSFLPSEIIAAFLWSQMEEAISITHRRLSLWNTYNQGLSTLEDWGKIRRPIIPEYCTHNAHLYYTLLPSLEHRNLAILKLKEKGIHSIFHYVPLHDSPAGKKYGRSNGDMRWTQLLSQCLIRLPLWLGMEEKINHIIDLITEELGE
jgi:dTDP-4-amino-4,6-dideoxygalactose transaminase